MQFDRGHYEVQFCEFISNFDKLFRRRCRLKYFYLKLWRPSYTIQALLKEGVMGNVHVKLH